MFTWIATSILILVWTIFGVVGFVYFETRENNVYLRDLPMIIVVSFLLGPVIWIIGWWRNLNEDRIIFKKRK